MQKVRGIRKTIWREEITGVIYAGSRRENDISPVLLFLTAIACLPSRGVEESADCKRKNPCSRVMER